MPRVNRAADSSRRAVLTGATVGLAAAAGGLAVSSATPAAAAAAAATPTPDWINVTVAPYGADQTGSQDATTAFQNAINALPNGGTVFIPSGTYALNSGAIAIATSNLRITGEQGATLTTASQGLFSIGSGAQNVEIDHLTIDVTGGDAFSFGSASPQNVEIHHMVMTVSGGGAFAFGSGSLRNIEIHHMTINVTGGDAFSGQNLGRCYFHDLNITQQSYNFGVWNMPGITSCLENRWERITSTVITTPSNPARTVPAWNFVASGNDLINENRFRDFVINNNGTTIGGTANPPDKSQPLILLDCNGAGHTYQNNHFDGITAENPLGGIIKILSGQQTSLERVRAWDLSADLTSSLIVIGTDAISSVGPAGTSIRDCGRSFGPVSGTAGQDIQLDSKCTETLIENYYHLGTSGTHTFVDLGGSQGAVIVSPPADLVLSGTSGASYTIVGPGGVTSAGSSGTVTGLHATPATPLPTDQNLIAWTFDPVAAVGAKALASGTVYLCKVILRRVTTVTNIVISITDKGAGLVGEKNFAGLYDSSGTLLSATADQTISWESSGLLAMALTAAQPSLAPGSYYVALLSNGTSPPALAAASGVNAALLNAGLTPSTARFATNGAAPSLPASLSLRSNVYEPGGFWAALS